MRVRQGSPDPHPLSGDETPCHWPAPPFPAQPQPLPAPHSDHSAAGFLLPQLSSFQLMHSVIHQWRSQGQLSGSGQTSLSLCQQGMLEITRHTTLIDAATVYTPHYGWSERAGINSLLLVCVLGGGKGGKRRRNKKTPFYDLLI